MDYSTSENLQKPTCNVEETEKKEDTPGEVKKKRGRPSGSLRDRGCRRHPGRVPVRKRLRHKKTHTSRSQQPSSCVNISQPEEMPSLEIFNHSHELDSATQATGADAKEVQKQTSTHSDPVSADSVEKTSTNTSGIQFATPSIDFHDYALPTCSNVRKNCTTVEADPDVAGLCLSTVDTLSFCEESSKIQVPYELMLETRLKVEMFLYPQWKVLLYPNSVHVVLMSLQNNISVQRNIMFTTSGKVDLFVHRKPVSTDIFLKNAPASVALSSDTKDQFVNRIVKIVRIVSNLEVCSGYDDEKFRAVWNTCPFGEVDKNPYSECRYSETFRSFNCARLVKWNAWRCSECTKLKMPLKRRADSASTNPHPCTPYVHLSEEQKLNKLHEQQRELNNAKRQISRLREKMQAKIEEDGVEIDNDLSSELTDIINSHSISLAQSIFLQQQIKASQQKKKVGMRWHPTMIRLALSLHITSPAAYEMARDTGMILLPSSRTLFDYAQAKQIEDGIDKVVLDSLGSRVPNFKHNHQKYHVLMADEMYISQNLVFQKSTGRMVGYTNLDDVDKEVLTLENFLNDIDEKAQEPSIAQKVLVYMVKGVSSGVKEVVATYAVANVSVSQMYLWTWEVIGALERSGIAVIAFVSDGFSVNRSFIKKHKPVTLFKSGVIFDTINKAAKSRVVYFISDVPHLLKTIRNCLYSSRPRNKKGGRRMTRKGKQISWDFIIKLYESNKKRNLRKSFKLNAMNVYPDGYARMKVKYAAEVISRTVAQDLEDQQWDDASELIFFLRFVNDWFDCLNGAHTSVGKKTRNNNLLPYCCVDDGRFDFLLSFLDYLDKWSEEAHQAHASVNCTQVSDLLTQSFVATDKDQEPSMEAAEEGVDPTEDVTPASQKLLSRQTLEGIEMSTRAIISLVKFLLSEGMEFVNARVFTQDPLEQHFSKLRAGQGGSNNPNVGQVLTRNRALHTIGQLGMKRRRGNAGQAATRVEVTGEPLAKRRSIRTPRICKVFE